MTIKTRNLSKDYKKIKALNKVSLDIKKGEIFGILGPNGAGKTTLLSILTTLLKPSSGTAEICGLDIIKNPSEIRRKIGVVFQETVLDELFTARENLMFHAELYRVKNSKEKIEKILKFFDLQSRKDDKIKTFSGGMKRKIEIARPLLHDPEILLLDEPTMGLDPNSRKAIWDQIKKINKINKTTILLNTHYLEEANELCQRIAILDKGKIVVVGNTKELKKQTNSKTLYGVFLKYTGKEIT
ncbi:MAG TPA: ATP-binding cassette domain-containing protein [Candidatus Nanoarchaeia archaeon]|nr:ATP-binding cassette domain-containing protein [Candidatus Nanoarchaeia archaeon]